MNDAIESLMLFEITFLFGATCAFCGYVAGWQKGCNFALRELKAALVNTALEEQNLVDTRT